MGSCHPGARHDSTNGGYKIAGADIRARGGEIVVMDLQLKGRVALVTGSTAGIGLAIGSRLAGEGATVIINGRTERRVGDAIATIRQKHPEARLEASARDLSTAAAAERIAAQFTHVDILINNLGSYEPKPFEAISGSGLAGNH